jgi:hypothetical protein
VRILLRLRKESTNLPVAPTGQDDGASMENIEEALASDFSSSDSQSEEFTNPPIPRPISAKVSRVQMALAGANGE